jgi:transcriptional regulator with XRE-family HTH domain
MSEIAQLYTSENYSHRVAAEVRSHAARQGLMQKDLAKALGYVPSQITKRMRGTVAFTTDELAQLAELFEIEVADLMPARKPKTGRAAAAARPASGDETLLRLDLNQQPFGYKDAQVRATTAILPQRPDLTLIPGGSAAISGQTDEYQAATRPETHPTFAPVIVRTLTVSA